MCRAIGVTQIGSGAEKQVSPLACALPNSVLRVLHCHANLFKPPVCRVAEISDERLKLRNVVRLFFLRRQTKLDKARIRK